MIKRHLASKLKESARGYPVVTVTGPRQSGKTTLVRSVFQEHEYVSLEEPDQRRLALEDPRGFLSQFGGSVILDEVQRAPELFSYIQTISDLDEKPGRFILTGSQNFLLLQGVSQSLAGRASIHHLLPLSLDELYGWRSMDPSSLGEQSPDWKPASCPGNMMATLFAGLYPRVHDKGLDPGEWFGNYYQTYLERDVRDIVNVGDQGAFERFVRLCAGRNGQLLNLSSLGSDCGVSHSTARRWMSVLKTSFLVTLLQPHHRNFNKRLVKSPKMYFLDTGLLCYLLGIRSPEELFLHSSRSSIFESFVLSEILKRYRNQGLVPRLFFWRDLAGHEIDLVVEKGETLLPIEIKSGKTLNTDHFKGLEYFASLAGDDASVSSLIHGGEITQQRGGTRIYPWWRF